MADKDNKDAVEVTQSPANAQGVERTEPVDEPDIQGAETIYTSAGRTVLTAEPDKSADQSSWPGGEADPEDPPVRTTRPDVPIVQSLATGAGQHVPPSLDDYTPEGRPRDLPGADES